MKQRRPWSADDDLALAALVPALAWGAVAAALERSADAVRARARALGLAKPKGPPHNTLPPGSVRVYGTKGYQYLKVAEGGWPQAWRLLHHTVWEAAHGPLPDDHILTFRDGNPAHTGLANLELVAKADWIMRYHPESTLPPELASLIRLKAVLTREINQRHKEEP
jgi:hypothetical protein